MGTNLAGVITGELMTHLGYSAAGEAKCPEGGVAKTAMHGPQKTCRKSQGVRARDARASPKDLEIADSKVREFVGRLITSSKKLASMLYREYVCVKVRNPLLTLLRESKVS